MAHEIENMMYVGSKPWHNLGVPFITAPSIDEAIVAAGLNWNVSLKDLVIQGTDTLVEAKATVRDSDNSVLGVVGDSYKVLQNTEAFKFFQPFLDANEATLECAGSLRQGKRVFVLAKLKRDPMTIVKGDDVEKYILLSNSHDGTMAVRVGFTPIRVVCANTLRVAIGSDKSSLIRVKHSNQMHYNLDLIRDIMNTANASFEATAEQYRLLASKDINSHDLEKYVKRVFEIKDDVNSSLLNKIIPLFEKGRGNDMPGVKGTYWAAYNSVTEYLTHERGRDADTRIDSAWFGQGASTTDRALSVALKSVRSS